MNDFAFVPVPIGAYDVFPALDADGEAARIADLTEGIGGHRDPWHPEVRDLSSVNQRLRAWAESPQPRSSLLYWAGHGEARPDGAWLAAADSPDPMTHGAVNPESFAEYVASEWRYRSEDEHAWALVVVEACGAQRFVELLCSRLLATGGMDRIAVIGVAGYGAGFLGRFRQVLSDVLASYSDNDETIHLRDLVGRVENRLGDSGWVQDRGLFRAHPLVRRPLAGPVTAPLDVYAELQTFLATLSPDERGHFLPKAQGAEQGELAWYFVGRREESARIAHWLRSTSQGMLVVTGEAGSGKSALLGNVVVRANPRLSALLGRAGLIDSAVVEDAPPARVFDAVLHLTGATTAEVVEQLAAPLRPPAPVRDTDTLLGLVTGLTRPFTVLADALDEAQEPLVVARDVLARLAGASAVRVIVGTRASTKEGPDTPAADDSDILDALGSEERGFERITVGRDRAATAEYVRRRLDRAFPDASTAELEAVCEEISSRDRQFLYARLAVHELIARPELLDAGGRDQRADLLARDYRALFASAADRLSRRNPAFVPLLEALAFGSGRGLPRANGVWPVAARALSADHQARAAIDEQAMDSLLMEAAPYVMLDAEHGQSVYRLAHRTFQEHYFAVEAARLAERHGRIATYLAAAAETAAPAPPDPYLVHHLATHVGEAGAWRLLVDRPRLLDQLSPGAVAVQAVRSRSRGAVLPPAVLALCAAPHRLAGLPPGKRGALRAVVEAQQSGSLPDPAGWRSGESGWRPLWAEFKRLRTPGTVFEADCHRLTSITTIRWIDGRTVVALLDDGAPQRIHLWDPVAIEPVAEPRVVSDGEARELAAVPGPEGHDWLAVGKWHVSGIGQVCEIWDPAQWKRLHETALESSDYGDDSFIGLRAPAATYLLRYEIFRRQIRVQDLGTGQETTVQIEHDLDALTGLRREDGSSGLVIAARGDDGMPSQLSLPDADVPIVVAPGRFRAVTAVAGAPGYVVLVPGAGHNQPVTLWNSGTDVQTALPGLVDVPVGGDLVAGRGHGGELLLMSITGRDRTVTVSVVTDVVPQQRQAARRASPGIWAVRTPEHGSVFALLCGDGEFGFREPGTGGRLTPPEFVRKVEGPAEGPLLIGSGVQGSIWSEKEGSRPAPVNVGSSMRAVPFAGPDGSTLFVQQKDVSVPEITCLVPGKGVRRWRISGEMLLGISALAKPGGGALILVERVTTSRDRKLRFSSITTVVLDTDRFLRRVWKLPEQAVTSTRGAALLHLPRPVLAVCNDQRISLWNVRKRRLIGKTAHHDGERHIVHMTAMRPGPADQNRQLLAVSYEDGVLRLWDPLHLHTPLAVLDVGMAATAMASSGSKLCLVNDQGALCIDVSGVLA